MDKNADTGTTIRSVEAFAVEIPFKRPFVVWRGTVPSKQHVLIRIETENSTVGWGEAAPFLFYAPETASDVLSMVRDVMTAELIGRDALGIRSMMSAYSMIDGHQFAKAAVETALWDIAGKVAGMPVSQLLGGRVRDQIPVVAVLHSDEPAAMKVEAREAVEAGYTTLKLKVGFGAERDEAMVAAVRDEVGPRIFIRVDAEESYTSKQAMQTAHRLTGYDLELISQPVPKTDWVGMAALKSALPLPVLADEGIHSSHDVLSCIQHSAADMVNIKVLKSGGILSALEMAALCNSAHLPIVVGSMIESGVGTLACAHVASVIPEVFSTELCGPELLETTLLTPDLQISDGYISLDDEPGLGATVSLETIEKYRVA